MRPLTVLSVSEGALGTEVLGLATAIRGIESELGGTDEFCAHVECLPPLGRLQLRLATSFPAIGRLDLDLQTVRWHAIQALRARRLVARRIKELSPDVLHVTSHTISFFLADIMRAVPTALSVDTTVWDWRAMEIWRSLRPWSKLMVGPSLVLERRALRAASVVLAWSACVRTAVERVEPAAHVVEHHPGVDLARFRPSSRSPRDRVRILFVGGRFRKKGGEDLIAVLEQDLDRRIELDIVTPEFVPERPGIRVRRIEWTDPALVEAYQRADVFCLPTYGDAVPFSVVEAMACGLPIIASDVGSIPDLLDYGAAGVLVRPGDLRGLRLAIEALAGDAAERERLGEAARAKCERSYDLVKQTARFADLLREIAESGGQRS